MQGYWSGASASPFSVEGVSADDPMVGNPVMPWEVEPGRSWIRPTGRFPTSRGRSRSAERGSITTSTLTPGQPAPPEASPGSRCRTRARSCSHRPIDYVLWHHDDHHAYRVIAMGDRPPCAGTIKRGTDLSRGRWEGNTLVIDTTNLNGYTWLDDSGDFYTDAAHLVERLTMVDREHDPLCGHDRGSEGVYAALDDGVGLRAGDGARVRASSRSRASKASATCEDIRRAGWVPLLLRASLARALNQVTSPSHKSQVTSVRNAWTL